MTTTAPGPVSESTARWVVRIYVAAALLSVLTLLSTRRGVNAAGSIEAFFDILNVPFSQSLFTVVLLFCLVGALARRKRVAWMLVFAFQVIGIVLSLLLLFLGRFGHASLVLRHGELDETRLVIILGGAFGIIAIVLLLGCRDAFPARLSPGSYTKALAVLVGGLVTSAVATMLLAQLLPTPIRSITRLISVGVRAALGLPANRPGQPDLPVWLTAVGGIISALALLLSAAVFLRSARSAQLADRAGELRIRELLAADGDKDSLGYFATRRDKSVVFAENGKAAITYRVTASVCLASADPIGPVDDWPAAVSAWREQARRYGWIPAVISASEAGARAYIASGMRVIPLGDEAIIDVADFRLSGPDMKPVRSAVNRIQRAGFTTTVTHHHEIDPAEMAELDRLAALWRGDEPERGFSMALSRLGDPVDGRCVMVVIRTAAGEPAGMLSLVPWGRHGLSLDLMRRNRSSGNGLVEAMVAALMAAAPGMGVQRVSLNFAMFRNVFAAAEGLGLGPMRRLNHRVLSMAGRFFQLESLYRSNAKYHPQWVPRYFCYESALSLPRAGIAAGMAEGFLPDPGGRHRDAVRASSPELLDQVRELDARPPAPNPHGHRLGDQERARRAKLLLLQEAGMDPYPVQVPRTTDLADIPDEGFSAVTGRVGAVRDFGRLVFADLVEDGATVQLICDRRQLPDQELFRRTVDRGDIVSVSGTIGRSDSGERSLFVTGWKMAAKSLRPLPIELTDPAARARNRSVDLIVNPEGLGLLRERSEAIRALRAGLDDRGYREVETPVLQAVHGGANARPFTTHINAYDADLTLRIAPELSLKRLLVGGSGPIYEIGRNFRNEGADSTHNPEFTSVEVYRPYADYQDMRLLTVDLIREVATAVHGRPVARRVDENGAVGFADLSGDWPVVTVHQAVSAALGTEVDADTAPGTLRGLATAAGVASSDSMSHGELVELLYSELVEKQTTTPTFYIDFPVEGSPLTRAHRRDPRLAERWDLVAFGMEIGTAYSELTDPVVQRERLVAQSLRAAGGDVEAMQIDEDFLAALETGMPPTGGLGIGVDRLVMLVTGTAIRQVLTFPFVRPAG
ncbi:bifunctional lysylphosphatidylglycerol synthetase/lysine--tRNA ligase LysX [Nakamurella silvestris]|nr:bifunctional lysylphosphatidylglycerol synthetase/lysine--tRNA ligase LysX [Nakamurella silvestris]